MTEYGNFPLDSVAGLPNVKVVFPGEHWSDGKASEDIVPGEAVVEISSGGKKYWRVAEAADPAILVSIALRCVTEPDVNTGPSASGPNELTSATIESGDWVHAYRSGAFALTMVVPDNYAPADRIGWDANGARPTGMGGSGAWAKNAAADIDDIFIVERWEPLNDDNEGILWVRSLRGQF